MKLKIRVLILSALLGLAFPLATLAKGNYYVQFSEAQAKTVGVTVKSIGFLTISGGGQSFTLDQDSLWSHCIGPIKASSSNFELSISFTTSSPNTNNYTCTITGNGTGETCTGSGVMIEQTEGGTACGGDADDTTVSITLQ